MGVGTRADGSLARGLEIGIVGGSLTGCAVAALLARAGGRPSVFERSAGNLVDRGVGLAMKISTLRALADRGLIDDDMGQVPVWERAFARPHADPARHATPWDVFWRQEVAFHASHWGVLYRALRERVPDGIYHRGHEVTGLDQRPDGTVVLRLADGRRRTFDLVICADGYDSTGRRILHPDAEIAASPYFLWRGMIDEDVLPIPAGHERTITFFGYPYGHGFVYYVPDPESASRPGGRRVNWAFHETVAGKDIPGIEIEPDGTVRQGLRPGAATGAQVAYCRAMARRYFPPYFGDVVAATPRPFIQPVFDARAPCYARGRICLMGDAAVLSRPHIGGGAGKALDDALAFVDALASHASLDAALRAWDDARGPFGNEVFDMGRSLGRHLVTDTPDWPVMDQSSMDAWWRGVIADRHWFWVDEVPDFHPARRGRLKA